MGLNATVRKLLTRNPGSSAIDAARVRNSAQVSPTDVANSITSVQRQIDAVVTVALADQTVSDPITVSGEDGGQIGWIGTVVQNTVSYLGMWFQNFWLGGTSPATAQIYSDSIGDVFIDGAEIVNTLFELNLNGVTTSIENLNSAVGVLSIKSLSNSTSYYSGATPTGFELLDNLGNSLGSLRSSGGSGHLDLSNVAATNTINLITGGGGAPKLSITSAAGTVSISPGTPLSVFGKTVIDSSRNAAFAQMAVDLKAAAVTGTSGGTGVGNAMLSATTAGLFLSLNGAAPVSIGAGGGTVTSVALTAPTQFAVTGSPVTSAGTLAIAWNNQTANTVLAGPTAGAAAAPTYRALVAADISGLVTPAGSTTQVQYNNAGAFGAAANFAWNNATNVLTVGPANTAGTGYVGTLFNSSATGTTAAFQTSAGTFSITGAGNAAFQQVALALKAAAVTGTSGGTGVGNAMLSATTAGLYLSLNGAAPVALGANVPGGSTTQVQYNNAGAFGGSANFAWDNATNVLTVGPANTAGTGYVGTLFNSSATGTTAAFQTSAGTFSITGAGNAAFQQVALALKAAAVTGTSGGTGVGNAMLSATTAGLYLSLNGAAPVALGANVPGGSTTQVQYNNAGAFGGSANFAWDNATNILTVGPANTAGTGYVGTLFNSSATGATSAFQTSTGTFSITGAGNAAFQGLTLTNRLSSAYYAPAGSNQQIQFNNSGAPGASASLTWNGVTLTSSAMSTSALLVTTSGIGVTGASSITSASALQTLEVGNTGGGNAIKATAGILVTAGGLSVSTGGLSIVAGGFSVVGGIVANGNTGFTGTLAAAISGGRNVQYGIIY